MIMDGPPAIALGLDPSTDDVMTKPPRPVSAQILSLSRLRSLLFHGIVMATGTLILLRLGVANGDFKHATTLSFTVFVLFQLFGAVNSRSEGRSVFGRHLFTNRHLWAALGLVLTLQILVVHWRPLQIFFETTALSLKEWMIATGIASSLLLLEEIKKGLLSRKTGAAI